MPSYYWIKLYHEINDDAKMGRLSDRLFRRSIQFFLLAGELDDGGHLPEIQDIAWRLRCDQEQLETEMIELQDCRILSKIDGRWLVTKFVERQAPISGAERVANYRDRKRKSNYYETQPLHSSDEDVTKRYTDIDIDKIRRDKEAEKELNGASADTGKSKPKKKGKERDPLLDNPAIIAYRDEARLQVPITWREKVCNVVDDSDRWRILVHDWIGYGWNKQNIKGMLEAYTNGGIKTKEEDVVEEQFHDYN